MENNKSVAACQPKVLSYNDKDMFEYAGAGGGWIDYLGYPFARGRVFDFLDKMITSMMMRKKFFGRAALHYF